VKRRASPSPDPETIEQATATSPWQATFASAIEAFSLIVINGIVHLETQAKVLPSACQDLISSDLISSDRYKQIRQNLIIAIEAGLAEEDRLLFN
jgi:hypothetical protein